MTAQYDNLATLESWNDSFKVSPHELPGERQMRARRVSGFLRARQAELPVVPAQEAASDATSGIADAGRKTAQIEREWVSAQWGLVPRWVKSEKDAKLRAPKLLVALNETVSTTQAFRDAWLAGQRCVIPMQAFYVEDLRGGKPVPTRIARVDGQPMGVAGVWECWKDPQSGVELLSYAILTINANNHALMRRYGHPGSDKRMPVILGEGTYDAWLSARQDKAREFMRAYPANWLLANPVENKKDKKPKGLFD